MARPIFLFLALLAILSLATICRATTYLVGGTSGWDISTDVDSWIQDKHFVVGDVLLFQYSSSHSVVEVNRDSYQGCNTTNVLLSSSNGNTTFALTKPGDRYFVCGNMLHCYAGMKLHVVVDGKAAEAPAAGAAEAPAPGAAEATAAGAPEAEAGGDPTTTTIPSSKSNNKPSSIVPNSAVFVHVGFEPIAFMGFTCLLLFV